MIAKTQYKMTPADLELTRALVRGGSLASAGERLGVDASTVFRNELASLTRRDADIAARATMRPPGHLVGKQIGPIRVALFAAARGRGARSFSDVEAGKSDWIAPDDALPEHPPVVWRKKHFPKVYPRNRVNSILSVMKIVALGLGVGILPLFLTEGRKDVARLTDPIVECETELWLLAHPESRHLRRVGTVYSHLSVAMAMP